MPYARKISSLKGYQSPAGGLKSGAAHGENCLFPEKYERFRPLYGEFIQNTSAGFHIGLDNTFCQL